MTKLYTVSLVAWKRPALLGANYKADARVWTVPARSRDAAIVAATVAAMLDGWNVDSRTSPTVRLRGDA